MILQFWRNRKGATAVEFALVFVPLITLLTGGIEAGNMAYARSVIEGSLRVASRMATTGQYSSGDIDAFVTRQVGTLGIAPADISITRKSYSSFNSVGKPEPITSDVPPLGGTPGHGDCFIDLNGDGQWSADAGSVGNGQSEDILYYGVVAQYTPLFSFLATTFGNGATGKIPLSANTVVKNEPYGTAQPAAVTRCIP